MEEQEGPAMKTQWRLDKTINLPMLFTVFTGMVTASVWAGTINQRVTNIEISVARVEATVKEIQVETNKVPVLDERSNATRRDLDRVIAEIAHRNGITL